MVNGLDNCLWVLIGCGCRCSLQPSGHSLGVHLALDKRHILRKLPVLTGGLSPVVTSHCRVTNIWQGGAGTGAEPWWLQGWHSLYRDEVAHLRLVALLFRSSPCRKYSFLITYENFTLNYTFSHFRVVLIQIEYGVPHWAVDLQCKQINGSFIQKKVRHNLIVIAAISCITWVFLLLYLLVLPFQCLVHTPDNCAVGNENCDFIIIAGVVVFRTNVGSSFTFGWWGRDFPGADPVDFSRRGCHSIALLQFSRYGNQLNFFKLAFYSLLTGEDKSFLPDEGSIIWQNWASPLIFTMKIV